MGEEEIADATDQGIRVAVSGAQQVAEQVARAKLHRGEKEAAEAQRALQAQSQQTRAILDHVRGDEFWRTATPDSVTNAAVYGAALAPHDPDALAIYSTVREGAQARWGVDVDKIYGEHSGDLDAAAPAMRARLAAAMRESLDDTIAAKREDELAAQSGLAADQEEALAQASPEDEPLRELHEERAEELHADEREHRGNADAYRADAAAAEMTAAGVHRGGDQARARTQRTFPESVTTSINKPGSQATKNRPARSTRSRSRGAELTR
ncbi:MAG: hypothetical protein CMH34_01610 [Microbacterium sp.]|nr:hypothetical protein [Microbacterium sp.]